MAIKTKPARGSAKKLPSFSEPKIQAPFIRPNRFDSPVILKNKKRISIGIGIIIAIAIVILLAVYFKNVFIAAMINGEPISRFSVVNALEKQNGKKTLDNLITKKIILQEAKKKNITVTQNEIDSEIKKITANLQSQGSTLDQVLTSQGMTMSDLNDEVKIQITINKLVGDATATEKEIDDFVVANKGQMTGGITEAQFREQATVALKQQKLQAKTQEFIKNLQGKAKIIRFVSY